MRLVLLAPCLSKGHARQESPYFPANAPKRDPRRPLLRTLELSGHRVLSRGSAGT